MDDAVGFLPLNHSELQILLSLSGGVRHGYAIMQDVLARTEGRTRLGPGTLYTAVKRMVGSGLIEEVGHGDAAEDGRRRSYRLTPLGRRVARAEIVRLSELVRSEQAAALFPQGRLPMPEGGSR